MAPRPIPNWHPIVPDINTTFTRRTPPGASPSNGSRIDSLPQPSKGTSPEPTRPEHSLLGPTGKWPKPIQADAGQGGRTSKGGRRSNEWPPPPPNYYPPRVGTSPPCPFQDTLPSPHALTMRPSPRTLTAPAAAYSQQTLSPSPIISPFTTKSLKTSPPSWRPNPQRVTSRVPPHPEGAGPRQDTLT